MRDEGVGDVLVRYRTRQQESLAELLAEVEAAVRGQRLPGLERALRAYLDGLSRVDREALERALAHARARLWGQAGPEVGRAPGGP